MIKIYQDLLLKNGLKFMINQKNITLLTKKIRTKTPMLGSDLCDFSDTYIFMKRDITFTEPNNVKESKSVAFQNNAPYINCI